VPAKPVARRAPLMHELYLALGASYAHTQLLKDLPRQLRSSRWVRLMRRRGDRLVGASRPGSNRCW
jgi:hypothetical protein